MAKSKNEFLQVINNNIALLEMALKKFSEPVLEEQLEQSKKIVKEIDIIFDHLLDEEIEELLAIEIELEKCYIDTIKLKSKMDGGSDNIDYIFE